MKRFVCHYYLTSAAAESQHDMEIPATRSGALCRRRYGHLWRRILVGRQSHTRRAEWKRTTTSVGLKRTVLRRCRSQMIKATSHTTMLGSGTSRTDPELEHSCSQPVPIILWVLTRCENGIAANRHDNNRCRRGPPAPYYLIPNSNREATASGGGTPRGSAVPSCSRMSSRTSFQRTTTFTWKEVLKRDGQS